MLYEMSSSSLLAVVDAIVLVVWVYFFRNFAHDVGEDILHNALILTDSREVTPFAIACKNVPLIPDVIVFILPLF